MALDDILHGIGEVAAVAMNADGYDYGAPTQKPATLPWVAVTFNTSSSERKTYNYRDPSDGKLKARGKMRKHVGIGYAILSISADIANEDAMVIEAVQDLMDAFDDDLELFGVGSTKRCDNVTISNVDRFRSEWDGTVYAGIQFEWTALEL